MLSNKLKAILGQIVFAVNVFVLFLVLAENRVLIPDWLHVFGRMHPLLLHFPIVLLLMALLLIGIPDLLKNQEDSRMYGRDLLLLGTLTAGFTVIAGLLLSHESGYEQDALSWHKWTGLLVFWTSSLLYNFLQYPNRLLIKSSTAFLALVVVLSGHLGASITHGEDFITGPLKSDEQLTVSLEEAEVFAHVVYPIIENKCVSCHKASKQKGELRMDQVERLLKGGESGPAIVPHDLENSLMVQRINLPQEDEEHMPPEGKPQLTAEEKSILEAWIQSGAPVEGRVQELSDSSSIYSLAVNKFSAQPASYDFDEVSSATLEELTNFYRKVQPLGLESPAVSVSYFGRASFDPRSLEELAPIQVQTVSINLNNMPLEDSDLQSLSGFVNLEKLYLNFASIQGEGLQYLKGLEKLQLLSLAGNPLQEAALAQLAELKSLKKLYLWNTGLSESSLEELRAALPGTRIESGTSVSETILTLNPPVITFDRAFFRDKLTVQLSHPIGTTTIGYTLDGTEPDSSNHQVYTGPLEIDADKILKARAFAEGWIGSKTAEAEFIQSTIVPDSFQMNYLPEDRHKGDGQESLFDRKKAIPDGWNLNWLGFLNNPLEVEMDFDTPTTINSMALSIWQNGGARFFPPSQVQLWTRDSPDQNWKLAKTYQPSPLAKDDPSLLRQFEIPFSAKDVRHLKLLAKPVERMPAWHGAAGSKAWLMVDEIVIN